MKKIFILTLFCFYSLIGYGQVDIKTSFTEYNSSTSKIILLADSSFYISNDEYASKKNFAHYDKYNQLKKVFEGRKTILSVSYTSIKDSMSVTPIRINECDVPLETILSAFPNHLDFLYHKGWIETVDNELNRYYVLDNEINVVNLLSNATNKFSLKSTKIKNLISLDKDTILVGDSAGHYFTATPNGEMKAIKPPFVGINTFDLIDFSPNYFYNRNNNEIYTKKKIKYVGKAFTIDNIKEINNKIYAHKYTTKAWEEHSFDAIGQLQTPKIIFKQFKDKNMNVNDIAFFNGKYIIAGDAYNAIHPINKTFEGTNDFYLILDSLNQNLNIRNDINFKILTQSKPIYNNNCQGYLFNQLDLNIENKGIDTLESFILKGGSYDIGFCTSNYDMQNFKGLKILPQTTQIISIQDYCVHSFTKTKDNIVTFCLRATVPNNSVDGDISNNMDCFSFKSFEKEIATDEIDLSQKVNLFYTNETINVTIHDDFQTAHLILFDITGKQILTNEIKEKNSQFEIGTSITSGLYLVKLVIDNQAIVTKKIVLD